MEEREPNGMWTSHRRAILGGLLVLVVLVSLSLSRGLLRGEYATGSIGVVVFVALVLLFQEAVTDVLD